MDIREICKRIRRLRLQKNLKLNSVAIKASMSPTGYGNIERGQTNNLSLNRLIAIAKALDVSVFEILPGDETFFVSKIAYESIINEKDNEIKQLKRLLEVYNNNSK
jgi:transcriptional regulator with XRE-family HTH domain